MRTLRHHKFFIFSLIAAFLLLQWSGMHVHLAGEHEHGSERHQHEVISHQHQLVSHHEDVIDIAVDTTFHTDIDNVVELDNEYAQRSGKLDNCSLPVLPSKSNYFDPQVVSSVVAGQFDQHSFQSYIQYTSIRLRAPPLTS
ncbi:MAG: hypothetical protein OEZ38_12235 [Gammaproteobacteria bacterium]|nr:hypothetical protein [Gammaproteobacteria bacterium]